MTTSHVDYNFIFHSFKNASGPQISHPGAEEVTPSPRQGGPSTEIPSPCVVERQAKVVEEILAKYGREDLRTKAQHAKGFTLVS